MYTVQYILISNNNVCVAGTQNLVAPHLPYIGYIQYIGCGAHCFNIFIISVFPPELAQHILHYIYILYIRIEHGKEKIFNYLKGQGHENRIG